MGNIFEIQKEYLELARLIEANDGVLEEEDAERLQINFEDFERKFRSYYYIIAETEGLTVTIDKEIERLQKLKTTKKNLISRLKNVLLQSLELYGDTGKSGNKSIDFGDLKAYTKVTKVVDIEDETLIPEGYTNTTFTLKAETNKEKDIFKLLKDFNPTIKRAPDKKIILNVLKANENVKGCKLGETKSIIIK